MKVSVQHIGCSLAHFPFVGAIFLHPDTADESKLFHKPLHCLVVQSKASAVQHRGNAPITVSALVFVVDSTNFFFCSCIFISKNGRRNHMADAFFRATQNALDSLTSMSDLIHSLTVAMWNTRSQVIGTYTIYPEATGKQLAAKYGLGSRIHGVNYKRTFRLSALNSTGLDVVKVRFIGQRQLYNNGTVKVVPLCIRRKQQANPSRRL